MAAVGIAVMGLTAVPTAASALTSGEIAGGATTASVMAKLLGGGVSASGIQRVGNAAQFATFTTGSAADIGFDSGVIMSTGTAAQAAGPNSLDNYTPSGVVGTSTGFNGPGDASVAAAAGTTTANTHDAAVMEFDFVPTGKQITFNYVFASEEYPEYVGQGFNDAFTFLVNGVSCASVPGTTTPVSINNVNRTSNASQYRDNALYARNSSVRRTAPFNVAYDGLTKVFSCTAAVREGETNHVKLAIADVGDTQLDSAVFLQANSFTPYVNNPPVINVPSSIKAEALDAGGTPVTYTATATDDHDGSLPATCSPASGSTFQVGTTTVTCTAQDSKGLTASDSFVVVVDDTTAPVLALPHDLNVEAAGPDGAVVDFDASAADSVDGATKVDCDQTSGETFALGHTTVTCKSTDDHGNEATGSFTITVADTTAPALSMPFNQTVEATGSNGAPATFQATAHDVVDGAIAPDCSSTSGDTFALGTTGVLCSATDAAGNVATGSFTVRVVDTTAPAVTVPEDRTIEAAGPEGAPGNFDSNATDIVDGTLPVTCDHASGDTFGFGSTKVSCTSTDAHGNSAEKSFSITVVDTTKPTLHLPGDLTADYAGPGTTQSWSATATDVVDGPTTVTCDRPSGSTFPVGSTTVACRSSDAHGNTAVGSFTVTVGYVWTGFAQPINDTGHSELGYSTFKAGSTVPVKFSLYDTQGHALKAAAAPVWVAPQKGAATSQPVDESVYTLPASTGTTLAYDAGTYQYNWSTSKSMAGSYWRIGVRLDDGSTRFVVIALR